MKMTHLEPIVIMSMASPSSIQCFPAAIALLASPERAHDSRARHPVHEVPISPAKMSDHAIVSCRELHPGRPRVLSRTDPARAESRGRTEYAPQNLVALSGLSVQNGHLVSARKSSNNRRVKGMDCVGERSASCRYV